MAASMLTQTAPQGTKLWLMNLGYIECDLGFVLRGGGASTKSNPKPEASRFRGVIAAFLIDHPLEGLILFEAGAGPEWSDRWGAPMNDIFAQIDPKPEHDLDKAIEMTGHKISDVKAVIMGHLHADHAGGLHYFEGTNVPIWVHEQELKHAYWSVCTKTDLGAYLPQNLPLGLNWNTFSGDFFEFAKGLSLIHAPGHTPGLSILQLNLPNSGSWLFTTDQYHVKDNYEQSRPQGWLAREHGDWLRSHQKIKALVKSTGAKLVFGHDNEQFETFKHAPSFYD